MRWHDPRLLATRTLDTPVPPPRFATRAAWEERARRLRQQILAAAGLWEDPAAQARRPPVAEVFERREHPGLGYAVEKVYFESLPGYFVTGNLYRPLPGPTAAAPAPAVLHPHGHAANGRLQHDALFSPALRCITFARMGYVAFALDMAGYGDNLRIPHRWGDPRAWLWGATPLGLQLWNCVRSLDFLAALPDVDPARLGCTGESGGGTQTFLLTAVDGRVSVSAPVNMVSLHMQGGCACENAPGLRLDTSNVEIAALAAPRPLLLVSATGDWTLNTPHLEFPAVQAIYDLFQPEAGGAPSPVETVQFAAPHNYNRQSREAVYDFFARRLPARGDAPARPAPPSEDDIPGPDAADDLRVFARRPWPNAPEGNDAVRNVTRHFQLRAEASLEAMAPEGASGVARLRAALLPALGAVTGVRPVTRAEVVAREDGDTVWLGRRGEAERFPLRRLGREVRPGEGTAGEAPPVLLRAADDETWAAHPFGCGSGPGPWAVPGRAAEAEHFLCYNRADAAWRAQDLLTAVAWLGGAVPWLWAGADCAVAALLARAFAAEAIAALDVELGPEWGRPLGDGPESDAAEPWLAPGNYLPGVLRAGGLAGLLALAAPWPVQLRGRGVLGRSPLAGVRALYAAMGAGAACVVE